MTIIITFDCMIQPGVSSSRSSRNKGVGAIPGSLLPDISRYHPPHPEFAGILLPAPPFRVPLETKGLSVTKTIILRVPDTKISCPGNPLR